MSAGASGVSVLVFEIGAVAMAEDRAGAYGVAVDAVFQVFEPSTLSPVPLAPPAVLGIMNHHGRIVTVVDPSRILEIRARELEGPESRVIMLRQGKRSTGNVGLRVTRVQAMVSAGELHTADVPAGPCIARVARHGHRLVNIIDVDSFLEELGREFGSSVTREPRQGVAL
jgi:purine-binding chemotaxis protein CheW